MAAKGLALNQTFLLRDTQNRDSQTLFSAAAQNPLSQTFQRLFQVRFVNFLKSL